MNTSDAYIIGIDIGGTHVDIVAVNQAEQIIASHKQVVFEPLDQSILQAIKHLLNSGINAADCKSIHLGTTLAINSLLELKSLHRVGVLRIAGHNPELPPAFNWPQDKKNAIIAGVATINGGFEYNKNMITPLDLLEVESSIKKLIDAGAESIAIVGVFSPLYSEEEERVAQLILSSEHSQLPLTLSHQVGGLGFIGRENNAIINATLKKVMKNHFIHLELELKSLGFQSAISITQNNGTLLSLDQALEFPIRTISSGPTNSLNGASKLAKLTHAIVIDIGGTSTEIGVVENGFPRYSSAGATIAGIPTHFMLPSMQILGLGGGSVIRTQDNQFTIGPDSVGANLFINSQSFRGDILTLFDIGNVLQQQTPELGVLPKIQADKAASIMHYFIKTLKNNVDEILIDSKTPVLLVGGGAQNIPESYLTDRMLRPNHYQVANAYGAALAEVCGSIDVIRYLAHDREKTMQELECSAISQALKQGAAANSVRIIEKKLLPFYYMQNQLTRIIITAAGKKAHEISN